MERLAGVARPSAISRVQVARLRSRRRRQSRHQAAVFGDVERFTLLDAPQVDRKVLTELAHAYARACFAFAHDRDSICM